MRYVLDASVAVAALRPSEANHSAALTRCQPFFLGRDEVVVPAIFDIEVFAALTRRGVASSVVTSLFEHHFAARMIITVGPKAAIATRTIAGLTRLRAADALYVWAAAREGLPLVTLGREVMQRAAVTGVTALFP